MFNGMVKQVVVLSIFSAAVFSCALAAEQPIRSANSSPEISGSVSPAPIGEMKAVEIALRQAGTGKVVRTELKRKKHGGIVYKVLVADDVTRFKVEVDANSGVVVKYDRRRIEKAEYSKRLPNGLGGPETAVTFGGAREIALERAGGGTVVDVEKDFKKDGRILYEVEVMDTVRKCEIEIDAKTGTIVAYEEKLFRR